VSRVLITGGGGFIGLHLARQLAEGGHEIDLLDDLSRGKRDADLEELLGRPGVSLIEGDLLAPGTGNELGTDYELVFHLAAVVGVANVAAEPLRVLRDNVAMTVAALEVAARQSNLARLVFASTSEIYAGTLELGSLPVPTPEDVPLTVPDPRRPRTSYMLSKLYGEALCLQSGLPVTVLRPHNVYGPRMGIAHVIPELLQRASATADGGRLEVYSVDHRRTFCFVSDAVEMMARAAEAPAGAGETLNLGAGGPEVAIGELAKLVLEVVGRDLEIEPLAPHAGSPARRCPDVSRMTELTGHEAQVPLEDGVRLTYDWYRENVFA
jgi:nucleoside-diphosphate-sugar epimerase